jgi:hypothetical protein
MATRGTKSKNWKLIKLDYIIRGKGFKQLSNEYGITDSWICKIAKRDKWHKQREKYETTTQQKIIEGAAKDYDRNRIKEAASFASIKADLKFLIKAIIQDNTIGNPKDCADLARAICMLEEREAVLCGETSQISEQRITANVNNLIRDISGIDMKELEEKFKEEQKKLREPREPRQIPEKV